jgi:hypothetical protein
MSKAVNAVHELLGDVTVLKGRNFLKGKQQLKERKCRLPRTALCDDDYDDKDPLKRAAVDEVKVEEV